MSDRSKMTRAEVARMFADPAFADRFPPLLTAAQVADLLGATVATVHHWSSRGKLDGCKTRAGRRLLVARDCLVEKVFAGGLR